MSPPVENDRVLCEKSLSDAARIEHTVETYNFVGRAPNDVKRLWIGVTPKLDGFHSCFTLMPLRQAMNTFPILINCRLDAELLRLTWKERFANDRIFNKIDEIGSVTPKVRRACASYLAA